VIHDCIPVDPIQDKGSMKCADLTGCLLRQYVCKQKSNSELGSSKTISNFQLWRLLKFFLVRHHMTFKLRVFQTNFASYEESTGSLVCGLFFVG